jgi:hypothetical protein
VHIADALADAAVAGRDPLADADSGLDLAFLKRLGMSADLPRWRDLAMAAVAR